MMGKIKPYVGNRFRDFSESEIEVLEKCLANDCYDDENDFDFETEKELIRIELLRELRRRNK